MRGRYTYRLIDPTYLTWSFYENWTWPIFHNFIWIILTYLSSDYFYCTSSGWLWGRQGLQCHSAYTDWVCNALGTEAMWGPQPPSSGFTYRHKGHTKASRQRILTRVNRASKTSCKSALLSVFSTSSSFSPERHSPYSTTFIYTNPSWFGLEVSWMSVHRFEDKTLSQDTTSPAAQLPCTAHRLASSLSSPFPFPVWKCILLSHVSGLCTFPLPRIFLFLLKGWGGSFPQFTTVEMSWLFPRPFWNDVLLCSSYLKLANKLHFYVL